MAFKCDKKCIFCSYGKYLGVDVQTQGKTINCNLKFACYYLDVKKVKMNIEVN